MEYYASCVRFFVISILVHNIKLSYNNYFTQRKCPDRIICHKKCSGVIDFYALLNFVQLQNFYWKMFIHGYLMYRISNDNKMSVIKAQEIGSKIDITAACSSSALDLGLWVT